MLSGLEHDRELGVNFAVVNDLANYARRRRPGTANGNAGFGRPRLLTTTGTLARSCRPQEAYGGNQRDQFDFVASAAVVELIRALETIGSTKILASPRILVLPNKQRRIQLVPGWGSRRCRTSLSAIQQVQFAEYRDTAERRPVRRPTTGWFRSEIHPEPKLEYGTTTSRTSRRAERRPTSWSPTGVTIVIGGLMEEEDDYALKGLRWHSGCSAQVSLRLPTKTEEPAWIGCTLDAPYPGLRTRDGSPLRAEPRSHWPWMKPQGRWPSLEAARRSTQAPPRRRRSISSRRAASQSGPDFVIGPRDSSDVVPGQPGPQGRPATPAAAASPAAGGQDQQGHRRPRNRPAGLASTRLFSGRSNDKDANRGPGAPNSGPTLDSVGARRTRRSSSRRLAAGGRSRQAATPQASGGAEAAGATPTPQASGGAEAAGATPTPQAPVQGPGPGADSNAAVAPSRATSAVCRRR